MSDKSELQKVEYRQSQTEREMKAVVETLATVGTKFTHLESSVSKLFQKFDEITKWISTSQKTPWQTILTFSGILLSVIGALWVLAVNPLKEQIKHLSAQNEKLMIIRIEDADSEGYQRAQLEILMAERKQ